MIYDCFLFLNELDLLTLRLEELDSVVDKFVILESNYTFSEKKKNFNLENNWNRYKKFHDKIIYNKLEFSKGTGKDNPWDVEIAHRRGLLHKLELKDDDLLMISDIDEILRADILKGLPFPNNTVLEFHLDWFHYKFNYKLDRQWTPGVKLTNYGHLKEKYNNSLHTLRSENKSEHIFYENAGWHFSYCCDIKSKIEAYGHQENNTDEIKNNIGNFIKNKEVFWDKSINLEKVEINNSYPTYLIENKDKFKKYIEDDNVKTK